MSITKTLNWQDLFGPITGKRKKHLTLANAQWKVLDVDSWFNGIEYAAGSRYKIFETQDFGWVIFHSDSKTPDGNRPGKFIHRY